MQAAAPGLFEYVPTGQLAQSYCEGEPVEPKYFPSPQVVQVGAPGTSLYFPVSQLVQTAAVEFVSFIEKLKLKNIATLSLTSSPANLSRGTVWTNRRPNNGSVRTRCTARAITQLIVVAHNVVIGNVFGNWTKGAAEGAG